MNKVKARQRRAHERRQGRKHRHPADMRRNTASTYKQAADMATYQAGTDHVESMALANILVLNALAGRNR